MSAKPGSQRPRQSARLNTRGQWSPDAASDRLSATLFLAALAHGVLILGVTFSAIPQRRDPAATSLDVVIVTREYEKLASPLNTSALLAQQNLIGRGNAPLGARLRTAIPASMELAAPGPDQAGELRAPGPTGNPVPARPWLTAVAREWARVRADDAGAIPVPAAQKQLRAPSADATDILAEPDLATVIPDANPRELLVSASTREARIAGYLNNWKNKVESIGTLNFPGASQLAALRAHPVLEVAITADGDLKEIVVRSSSGYHNLDQAAMEILRIAAPFEPFPQVLRQDYDVLRFAYEWHFGSGSGVGRIAAVNGS